MRRGLVLLLAGVLAGCTLFSSSGRIIYQQGRTAVVLETDPSTGGTSASGWNSHPASIKSAQLAALLRGVRIQSEQGIVGKLLSFAAPADAVFTEEELALLAPVLADGLAQAGPSERVAFTLWSSVPGRRGSPLSGSISIRGPYLRFVLNEHPTVGWQDPGDPSAPKIFELEFLKQEYLLQGSEKERKATYKTRPLIQLDYRRYLAALDDQGGSASMAKEPPVSAPAASSSVAAPRDVAKPDAEAVKELQHRVRELNEELARLRQELAEAKQLLADKVMELNRPKNKSGGTDKGKK